MGQTIAQKILAAHSGNDAVEVGQIVTVAPDYVLSHDNTAAIAKKFEKLGFKVFSTEGTRKILIEAGISNVELVGKIRNPKEQPNILDMLMNKKFE